MTGADGGRVLELNESSVWALSPLDAAGLERARDRALLTLVCEYDGEVAAFTIVYGPGSPYESVNYAWHADRFEDFLYLDRIAVDTSLRRRGIASAMYDMVEGCAVAHGRLVCEVSSTPPNVESLAFHRGRGYHELGHLTQPDGHEAVLLEKPL
jgi:hypothetical protein